MIATRTAINETINKAYSQQTVSNVMDNLNKEYNRKFRTPLSRTTPNLANVLIMRLSLSWLIR